MSESHSNELSGERGILLLWKLLDRAVISLEDTPPIRTDSPSAVFVSRARVTYSETEKYYTLCYAFISRDSRLRNDVSMRAWELMPRWETDGPFEVLPIEESGRTTELSLESAAEGLSDYLTWVRDGIVRGEPSMAYPIDVYGGAAFDSDAWTDSEGRDCFCFCYVLATGLEACWDSACQAVEGLPTKEEAL